MILHIVRHAEALPQDETVDDAQRQVTKNGAEQFMGVLKAYKKADEMDPDVIFSGPETRNMQTAEIARAFFDLPTTAVLQDENLGPLGDPKEVQAAITQWVKDNAKGKNDDGLEVLVVGANPALASFFQLMHGLGTKAGQSGAVKLKKSSVAKLKVYGITGDRPTSQLRSYLPPRLARAA